LKRNIANISRILKANERKKFNRLIVSEVCISLLDIFFLAALLFVIRFYSEPGSISWPSFFPAALNDPHHLLLIIAFFVLFSIKNFLGYVIMRKQQTFVYAVATRLSKEQLNKYLDGTYENYTSINSSIHTRSISQMPIEFGHYVLSGIQQIISQSILIFITLIAVLAYSPVLLPLLFAILGVPLLLIGTFMKKRLSQARRLAKTSGEKAMQHLQEALAGYIEGNVYERKDFFTQRFATSQANFNDFLAEQQVVQNTPARLIEVFAILGLLVLIFINSVVSPGHSIQVVTIGAFMAAAYKIIPGIVKILNSAGQVKTYSFTIDAFLPGEGNITAASKRNKNIPIQSLAFQNVSFKYNGKPVLDRFSCSLSRGKFVGITGKSGKGKTTLLHLLLGFLDAHEGLIRINDEPATAAMRKLYWEQISYVKQHPFVLHDSLYHNITLEENTQQHDCLTGAITATHLDNLVNKGFGETGTPVHEDGKNISGGQRQRIAVARALYKESDLILLDEPFNELDRLSENQLLHFFRELAHSGKIVILVTHDRESLSFCDHIISLDEN
jgi:ABC-type bacteriocin/lantibiotic exporter with double-glycine peptidase domain